MAWHLLRGIGVHKYGTLTSLIPCLLLTAAPALSWWMVGAPMSQLADAAVSAPSWLAQREPGPLRLSAEPNHHDAVRGNLASRDSPEPAPRKPTDSSTSGESPLSAEGTSDGAGAAADVPEVSAGAPDAPSSTDEESALEQWELHADIPRCENVYVYIVSDWVDGGAMATVALGRRSRGYPKRVGAHVGDYEVISIGPSGLGLGPAVWLAKGDELCQALLFDDNPVRKKARRKIRARKKSKKRKKKRRRRRKR